MFRDVLQMQVFPCPRGPCHIWQKCARSFDFVFGCCFALQLPLRLCLSCWSGSFGTGMEVTVSIYMFVLKNSRTMSCTSKAVPHLGCLAHSRGNCSTDCLFFCEGATFVHYWIIDAFAFFAKSDSSCMCGNI